MSKIQKSFNAVFVVLAVLALAAAPAAAQEISPEQMDLARKYVTLTDRGQVYETAILQAGINTMQVLTSQNPGLSKEVSGAIGETVKFYAGRKSDLLDQFARIYAANFTGDELTQIVAFYETDVGKKLADNNFEINRQLSAVMRVFEGNLSTEFLAKVRATLKAKGIDI